VILRTLDEARRAAASRTPVAMSTADISAVRLSVSWFFVGLLATGLLLPDRAKPVGVRRGGLRTPTDAASSPGIAAMRRARDQGVSLRLGLLNWFWTHDSSAVSDCR